MTHRVRLLRPAARDLHEIDRYLARESPHSRLVDEVLAQIESLARLPSRGALPRDERLHILGFRVLRVKRYRVFYKVERRSVWVYRVLHERREHALLL